jgi:hypothetical protein
MRQCTKVGITCPGPDVGAKALQRCRDAAGLSSEVADTTFRYENRPFGITASLSEMIRRVSRLIRTIPGTTVVCFSTVYTHKPALSFRIRWDHISLGRHGGYASLFTPSES